MQKHQTVNPPKPPAKPHKVERPKEPTEVQEPQLPTLPKSVDWDEVLAIVEKHVGEYLKKVQKL